MTNMQQHLKWLKMQPAPKLLVEALKFDGVIESAGNINNPVILGWAQELGKNVSDVYKADSIPWCGLFIAIVVKNAGYEPVKNPLWALSWAAWGNKADVPSLGDVMVFVRNGGGHLGIYAGENKKAYLIWGGNQSDKVCLTWIDKKRFYVARRSPFRIGAPANVRPIQLLFDGNSSHNEA